MRQVESEKGSRIRRQALAFPTGAIDTKRPAWWQKPPVRGRVCSHLPTIADLIIKSHNTQTAEICSDDHEGN